LPDPEAVAVGAFELAENAGNESPPLLVLKRVLDLVGEIRQNRGRGRTVMGEYEQGLKAKSAVDLNEESMNIKTTIEALENQGFMNVEGYEEKMAVLKYRHESVKAELNSRK